MSFEARFAAEYVNGVNPAVERRTAVAGARKLTTALVHQVG